MSAPPFASIAVGVVVERVKAESQWADYLWRPVSVLAGVPETPPWTKLGEGPDGRTTFYAGQAHVDLYLPETTNYRDNLVSENPSLWVVLRETGAEPPYDVFLVTADPAEGEGLTESGSDLVEAVPMPEAIRDEIEAFVTEHHVERVFVKRKRDRADTEALGRRPPDSTGDDR